MKTRTTQGVVAAAGLVIVLVVAAALVAADELVPPGEVVSTTWLWHGTTETSINGKVLRGELRVQPGASLDDPPKAILINTGEVPFGYGNGHTLDRLSRGFWEPLENHVFVTLELNGLSPGGSAAETITYSPRANGSPQPLPSGEYRIKKEFEIDSGDRNQARTFEIFARFLVE